MITISVLDFLVMFLIALLIIATFIFLPREIFGNDTSGISKKVKHLLFIPYYLYLVCFLFVIIQFAAAKYGSRIEEHKRMESHIPGFSSMYVSSISEVAKMVGEEGYQCFINDQECNHIPKNVSWHEAHYRVNKVDYETKKVWIVER